MKDYKEELMEYCKNTMKAEYAGPNIRKDWIFGAIEFSYKTGLIDEKTFDELLYEYGLI